MDKQAARKQFADLMNRSVGGIELDRGALLIAVEEYPSLDVEDYLARLDGFASEALARCDDDDDQHTRLFKLRDFLFRELGFSGNQDDYYDPRNSFLNDVIDRRKGIPISLSVLFIEVARRLDLPLRGVGMPGHFIVRCNQKDGQILLDPFREGRELTEDDCRGMISKIYGDALAFHPSFLRPMRTREILMRMLKNLKGIYLRTDDHSRLLGVLERTVLLMPGLDASEIRDRGLAYLGLGKSSRALLDLEAYLRRVPQAPDRGEIRKRIGELRQQQALLN